jgi:[glutamine synthetase] adenylyltransferase / [glutamine synthetase]-adenylyl-L-tyrosine phosphorylase
MNSLQDVEVLRAIEAADIAPLPAPDQSLHYFHRFQNEAPAFFEQLTASPTALRCFLTIASYSAFLSESVIRHPQWLFDLTDSGDLHRSFTLADFDNALQGFRSAFDLAAFRRRQLLRIVLRDTLGVSSLAETTGELSALADSILNAAYQRVLEQLTAEHGAPHTSTGPALFSVISLGKLGGGELNYSSDIDLMFLYSGNGETASGLSNKEFFKKLANLYTELLSTYTAEGMCYRVDLRLRPDGRFGELCSSLEGARHYYQNRARDWELQMLIKARVSAGDSQPGLDLLNFVDPSIYATSTDFTAIESVSEARQRIHEKLKRATPGDVDVKLDIKLTPGGIRDIEFLVQCLQRLHGAREPWVRHGGTQQALGRLRDKELLSDSEYSRLASAYQFLRCLEHRLQFDQDRQTHSLPTDSAALNILARKMPYRCPGTLQEEVDRHLTAVREIYEAAIHQRPAITYTPRPKVPTVHRNPARLEHFVERIAAYPERLEAFENNPEVRACTLDLFEHSDFFGAQLVRYPELIDEIRAACGDRQGRLGFHPPHDVPSLAIFFRRQMVRIQSDSVYHSAPIFKTLKRTSDLADSVIDSAYRIAVDEALAASPPTASDYQAGNQMMVIALGRLGMREFDLASDADLVFAIPDVDASEVVFWTGVAGRLIHAISSYTGDGNLFTVDTRLRPNGREGALVQTESAFREYFEKHAEAWEGIAYMKARAIAGDTLRATLFLSELQQLDWRRYGQSGRSRRQLAGMRARLEKEQGRRNPLKAAPGGYYDIDFALMYYRLKGAGMFFKSLTTPERIDIVEKMGHLERDDAAFLHEAATFYRALDHGLRISTGHAEGRLPAQVSALSSLVRRWDPMSGAHSLLDRLRDIQQRTRAFYDRTFS